MKLLLKRDQTQKGTGRIVFELWGKFEPDEEELKLIEQYQFRDAILTGELQEGLRRQSAVLGLLVALVVGVLITSIFNLTAGMLLGLIAGGAFAYWWFNEKREVILVKDMLHGRTFKCDGVIDLAKQEAHIEYMAGVLRQVLESCKHWDGTETLAIEALPKDEAKQFILSL